MIDMQKATYLRATLRHLGISIYHHTIKALDILVSSQSFLMPFTISNFTRHNIRSTLSLKILSI